MKPYLFLLFLNLSCVCCIFGQAPAQGGFLQPSFGLPNDNLGFLDNSVNLFSGQVQFTVPISGIAGKNSLSFALTINYSSKVKFITEIWNREAPTGVLGLGWNIDLPRIIVDHKGTGTREDDTFYLVEGGSANELVFDGMDGSEWKFYPKAYSFWKIRYNPSLEKWTITKDDGTVYVYGDKNSTRLTVQYMVKWGNWIGNSSISNGQQQLAYVWSLSEIIDLWGDKIIFEYLQDLGFVGDYQPHTRASYLKEVKNTIGEKITLTYSNKLYNQVIPGTTITAKEYERYNNGYAYQDKFETKYLDKVIRYGKNNQVAEEVRFTYSFMGEGELAKRLLNSITRYSPLGEAMPSMVFTYENRYDTHSTIYNTGALTKVTSPLKGEVEFTYTQVELEGTSLDFLVQEISNYGEPKFWIAEDYVVISRRYMPTINNQSTHSTDPQNVRLDVYTWEGGKWIAKNVSTLIDVGIENLNKNSKTKSNSALSRFSGAITNYSQSDDALTWNLKDQKYQLAVGRDFFATINQRGTSTTFDVRLFKRNEGQPGEWFSQLVQITDVFSSSNTPKLLAGEDFVLVGGDHGKFYVFEWNGTSWNSWDETLAGSAHDYFYGVGNNYFIVHDENSTSTDIIKFYFKDKAGQWQQRLLPSNLSFNSEYDGASYWYTSNTFAVVMASDNLDFIYTWDESYSNFNRYIIDVHPFHFPLTEDGSPVILNSELVLVIDYKNDGYQGFAFRFDGQAWKPSGKLNYFGQEPGVKNLFSISNDFIYRPYMNLNDPQNQYPSYIRRYDPNINAWRTDVPFARSNNNFASLAGYNFFLCDGKLYFKNPDGSFTSPTTTQLYWDIQSDYPIRNQPISAGMDFLAYSTPWVPSELRVIFLKNGQVHSEIQRGPYAEGMPFIFDYPSTMNAHIASPQVGPNTIIACLGTPGDLRQFYSKSFKLFRKIGNRIDGKLSDFVVTKVTVNDGLTEQPTSYAYNLSTATTDVSGFNFQFNQVTVVPGSDNVANKPHGYTENYFLNGNASSQLPQKASYPAVASNMGSHYNKLTGLPYKTIQYNAAGNIVSKSSTDYEHYFWNQYSPNNGFYIRPVFTISEQDGLKVQTQYMYNATTRQVSQEIVKTIGPTDNVLQTVTTEYIYWWEWYDSSPAISKNILTPIVAKRRLVDWVMTSQSATRWKNWGPNNTPAPFDSYVWVGPEIWSFDWNTNYTPPANWRLVSKVNLRDEQSGMVLEEMGNADQVKCVILDETARYPVAQITNAAFADVAYCGFEDSATGNFSWNDGTVISGDARTGSRYFSLGSNGLVKSGLNPSTHYKISFWAKSNGGAIHIDGITGTINLGSLADWTFFEYAVTGLASLSIRRSGSVDVQLDDVRVHPVNAVMTTSTFHPVFGITSETGSDQRTIFYEHDSFGRVKFVRDHDKNIVRHSFSNFKQ
jgi:hypothetical protein